jgi:maltooligosyltrehalose trehalohydrolase
VQPYLIGLLMATGIPLLWQGQELGENYWIPEEGRGRIMLLRPVRWEYFYDVMGRQLLGLVRSLLRLRRTHVELRTGDYAWHNRPVRHQAKSVLVFERRLPSAITVVAINVSDAEQVVPITFPVAGAYGELLHGDVTLIVEQPETEVTVRVPSNYGRVWRATIQP